jgi:hypothetical protein
MRKEVQKSSFEIDNQWGKYGETREIISTQKDKSKPVKDSEVVSTSETRKVSSKRTEKPSKARQSEVISKAKARVIFNQAELEEIKKTSKVK